MASTRPLLTALSLASVLLGGAPALAQDGGPDVDAGVDGAVDGGVDPCNDACGPDLRCIELDGEWYCGECAIGDVRECPDCPGSVQSCGNDLYWEPCPCDGCGDGPACGPGLECIDVAGTFYCGICEPEAQRPCSSGCGNGVETCQNDLFWGRCVPTEEVQCVPGDELPCESQCGPGTMQCDAASCTWTDQCVPIAVIQCLPQETAGCTVGLTCPGQQTCSSDCNWGACVPTTECHECGDGTVDEGDGEQCDDGNLGVGDGCDADCQWEKARPFRSFDCGTAPGSAGVAAASLLLVIAAFVLIRRRPLR